MNQHPALLKLLVKDPDDLALVTAFAPDVLARATAATIDYMHARFTKREPDAETLCRAAANQVAAREALEAAITAARARPLEERVAALLASDDPDVRMRAMCRLHELPTPPAE